MNLKVMHLQNKDNLANLRIRLIFVGALLILLSPEKILALQCSRGFLPSPHNVDNCYKIKPPETYESKYVGCPGNVVAIDFYNDYRYIDNVAGNVFWTDYVRAYEDGPLINWRLGDVNMGRPVENFSLSLHNKDMCTVVDIQTRMLMLKSCDLEFSRICELPSHNQEGSRNLSNLKIKYSHTEKNSLIFEVNFEISINDIWCFTDSTSYFPERTKVNHHIVDETAGLRSNLRNLFKVSTINDGYYWCLSTNTLEYTSQESEKFLYVNNRKKYVNNAYSLIFDHANNEQALLEINVTGIFFTYINVKETEERITRIENDKKLQRRSKCEILTEDISSNDYKQRGDINISEEDSDYYDYDDLNGSSVLSVMDNSINLIILEIRLIKIYDKRIQMHAFFDCDLVLNTAQVRDVLFMRNTFFNNDYLRKPEGRDSIIIRKIFSCESIGNIQEAHIGTRIQKIDDCQVFSCEGDFNVGGFWNISVLENCTQINSVVEHDTTSDPPIKLHNYSDMKDNLETINEILNGPVTSTNLTYVVLLIDNSISSEENVTISPKMYQNLELAVSRVILPKNESHLKIVQPHIAIVVADSTDNVSYIGIKVSSTTNRFINTSVHILTQESRNEDTETNDIVVNVSSLLKTHPRARLSFVIIKNDTTFQQNNNNNKKVNSPILGISIGNISSFEKGEYIDINFRPYLAGSEKKCAFWNFNMGPGEEWSTDGCKLLNTSEDGNLDTCRCYHLTYFAELITTRDVGVSISKTDYKVLSIISYSGCTFSLIGLTIICLTGILFESWRNNFMHKIWMNLSGSFFIMIICFIFISYVDFNIENKVLCIISGITLHYSVLATFCWMLVEAMFYYQMATDVFKYQTSSDQARMMKAIIVGWVVPAIPVIVLLSINHESYWQNLSKNKYVHEFCYPSGNGFWLAVLLPIVLIIMFNSIIFIFLLYSIYKLSPIKKHDENHKFFMKTFFGIFYQFGLVWMFGILSQYFDVMAYLFCIALSLQGLILCLFFVVGDRKTRRLWLDKCNFGRRYTCARASGDLSGARVRKFRINPDYKVTKKIENESFEYTLSSSITDDKIEENK